MLFKMEEEEKVSSEGANGLDAARITRWYGVDLCIRFQ